MPQNLSFSACLNQARVKVINESLNQPCVLHSQDWMKCLQTFCSNLRKPLQTTFNKRLRQVREKSHCFYEMLASVALIMS